MDEHQGRCQIAIACEGLAAAKWDAAVHETVDDHGWPSGSWAHNAIKGKVGPNAQPGGVFTQNLRCQVLHEDLRKFFDLRLGCAQMNFESRPVPRRIWTNNSHVKIV